VFQNGCYEANGRMPLPVPGPVDFAQIARAAGIASAVTLGRLDALDQWLGARPPATGPTVVDLRVAPSATAYAQRYDFIHSAQAREAFRRSLPPPAGRPAA
jgi:hypothetical protein